MKGLFRSRNLSKDPLGPKDQYKHESKNKVIRITIFMDLWMVGFVLDLGTVFEVDWYVTGVGCGEWGGGGVGGGGVCVCSSGSRSLKEPKNFIYQNNVDIHKDISNKNIINIEIFLCST